MTLELNSTTAGLRRYGPHVFAFIFLTGAIPACMAAGYPERPVRLIVPSAPGGGTDTSARIISPKLAEYLGQQVIIDNRAGAGAIIGAEIASKAAPDGYTLLMGLSTHTINPAMVKKLPFDFARDFAPISVAVTVPMVLVSHPSLPAKTVKELIAFSRARPGQLQFASAGHGTNPHLTMELFLNMTGLKMVHVPYKGVGPALVDVVAGHVPMMTGNMLSAYPQIKSGRVRAYGVTSAKRAAGAPEIPTIAESGVPGFEVVQWFGLLAPAGTPREIIMRLHAGMVHLLQDPAIKQRLISGGAEATPSASPEEFAALIRAELIKWAKVVKDAGIQPE